MSHSLTRRFWLGPADLKCVGLFRITFGLATLSSILDVAPVLRAALSDEGFMPRWVLMASGLKRFSLMDVSGPLWVTYGYWLLTVVACLAFVVGWHSRLATFSTFVLASGMMERNLGIFDSSDDVIRVLLFWSLFLPVGNAYSIDAALARAKGQPLATEGPALALRLIGLQIGWIYLCTFLQKLPGETWHDGTAVHIALGLEHYYTRPLGHLMRAFPWSTAAATYFTLAVEAAFLPLAFLPMPQPQAKALALLSGFALHAGIWLTMCIGGFSWVMVAAYPLLFEPAWVDFTVVRAASVGGWLGRRLGRWVPPRLNELLRAFARTTAGAPTGARTDAPANAPAGAPAGAPVDETRGTGVGSFADARRAAHLVGRAALVALFVLSVWSSVPMLDGQRLRTRIAGFVQVIELWQKWAMFAPEPPGIDIELRGAGKLLDGTEVDVLRGDDGPLPPAQHDFLASRWTAVTDNVAWGDRTLLLEFGRFLCREWNRPDRPAERSLLATFRLSRVERYVPHKGRDLAPPRDVFLWDHACLPASALSPPGLPMPSSPSAP